ncbi:MAG: PorT family protein [Bacteroidales bacterium]|nr:PorT family protein [Bacteroidales bacterium]
MNRIIVFLFLISCCATNICVAQEQVGTQKTLTWSVRGGLNIANHVPMSLLSDPNYKWLCAFNIGVTCDISKSETFAGRTGLYYFAKGYKNSIVPYTHLNYMEMPILAVFQKPIGNNVKLELQTGVYFAYGICGEAKVPTSKGYCYEPSFKDNNSMTFKRFDWGWNVGAGVNIGHVYLGGAYEVSAFFGKKHTNHCWMIDLGYTF